MASTGGDNDKREEKVKNAPHVEANEGESRHALDDSSMEYVRTIRGS